MRKPVGLLKLCEGFTVYRESTRDENSMNEGAAGMKRYQMTLREQLILKASILSYREIALFMGYNKHSAFKASKRIHDVLNSKTLGLDSSDFDFKYSIPFN